MPKALIISLLVIGFALLGQAQTVSLTTRGDTAYAPLADGFDYPVGKPNADGYYKARGYRPNGHLGEDWDGVRGGDTDLGDPIYCIGEGLVVFAQDVHLGWGNVIIVRHLYREEGEVKTIDSLYGHLDKILVKQGQRIARGQKIGTMGTAHGKYEAHLHFEIRKNVEIGMSRSDFRQDYSNYFSPTEFIEAHRTLPSSNSRYPVAINTFTRDGKYHFELARNGTSSSAAVRATDTAPKPGTKNALTFERVTPLED